MIKLKKEIAKGQSIEPTQWIAETAQQKAIRDFWYIFSKSIGLLWIISKTPFLNYKDWIKTRIEEDNKISK